MIYEFPKLAAGPDSRQYSEKIEDPSIRTQMEGGYTVTRPRFTRRPRRKFAVAYTFISADDKKLLEGFWNAVKGGSGMFWWPLPYSDEKAVCRFGEGEIDFQYVGAGGNHRWDVKMAIEEV
ncbi:hypothetical protein [Chromobacterium phragmitis]|uniref:Phage tail protein n=1 Tax=Chromobacterium phragmitis TaxID=2202141 RepID=A0ABV0J0K4_9NEIS